MRNKRHDAIITLINENSIETQQELTSFLSSVGFDVTQATVSRDVRELGLHKKLNSEGRYVYTSGYESKKEIVSDEMNVILSKSIAKADYALNTVVIKTLAGMAPGAASVIDAMHIPECLGTIAGDDTIFVIARSEQSAQKLCKKLKDLVD